GVRGNLPSPSSSEGAVVIGPHRYRSCSALSVSDTPTSWPRCAADAARAHGAGTMSPAEVAAPWSSASRTPSLLANPQPSSSAVTMTSGVSAAYPSRSTRVTRRTLGRLRRVDRHVGAAALVPQAAVPVAGVAYCGDELRLVRNVGRIGEHVG